MRYKGPENPNPITEIYLGIPGQQVDQSGQVTNIEPGNSFVEVTFKSGDSDLQPISSVNQGWMDDPAAFRFEGVLSPETVKSVKFHGDMVASFDGNGELIGLVDPSYTSRLPDLGIIGVAVTEDLLPHYIQGRVRDGGTRIPNYAKEKIKNFPRLRFR